MTARSIATVSLSGLARRKAARRRRRRLRRRRDFRERPLDVQRQSARRRQSLPRPRAFDLRVPAVSRFRGHARAAARPQFCQGRTQVRPDAGIRDRFAADLQQCFAGLARRHRPRRRGFSRTWRTRRGARPARRLRGAGLGPPRQRLSRRLGDRAARRPQVDRNHSRQLSCAGAGFRSRLSIRSRRTRSFWSSSRTRRNSVSTYCPGAGISAASPDRAICRWRISWKPCRPPATPARCRWKFSTISFAPAPRSAPRPTDCVR